jgi:cytoskeletal protein CcmA (bactofilin family)/predicted RNA-binding Zn-ribbon protein involved in translation (DUF1610 family)
MPFVPRKAPSRCPHCGFVQDEPEHLISTYCHGCGNHYEVRVNSATRALSNRFQWIRDRIGGRVTSLPARKIRCHSCSQIHEVSGHARSTLCPHCNAAINLCDVTISSSTSRPIDTRGNLTITSSGYLCSALTVCREAFVAGRISGTLVCEDALYLTCSERLCCQMNAAFVVIERHARLELTCPIKTGDLTVHGQAAGYFECAGSMWIARGGLIEGCISASSVIVERGGTLLAETSIRPARSRKPVQYEDESDSFFISAEHPLPAY